MALFVSCILTMHMMLYFFHHFELPFVLNTFQIRNQTIANFNNDPNATRTTTEEPPRDGNLNDSEVTPPDNIVLESNLGIHYFLLIFKGRILSADLAKNHKSDDQNLLRILPLI